MMPCKMAFCSIFISLFSRVYCVLCLGVAEYKRDLLLIIISGSPRVTLLDFPPFVNKCSFFFIQNCIHETILKINLKPSKKQVVGLKSTIQACNKKHRRVIALHIQCHLLSNKSKLVFRNNFPT